MRTTLLLLTALACNDDAGDCPTCPACPEAAAAAASGAPGETTLEAWEAALLKDQLDDLRAGVRPYGERGFGLCTGTKTCKEFLGTEPSRLEPGSYLLRAELAVPQLGEGWKAHLERTCDDGGTPYTRDFDVRYAGAGRGYRLEPLFRVEVKAGDKAKSCTATLTPVRPNGAEAAPLTARWSSGTAG